MNTKNLANRILKFSSREKLEKFKNGEFSPVVAGETLVFQEGDILLLETPSKLSQFENDCEFIDISALEEKQDVLTEADKQAIADLYQETDPTVPDWAKQATKPSYTASEVGALPNTTVIPSIEGLLSEATADTKYQPIGDYATKEELAKLNKFEIAQPNEQGYPDITTPDGTKIYLVLRETSDMDNIYNEFIWVKKTIEGEEIEAWEFLGNTEIDITGLVKDVQINGESIVEDNIANIPTDNLVHIIDLFQAQEKYLYMGDYITEPGIYQFKDSGGKVFCLDENKTIPIILKGQEEYEIGSGDIWNVVNIEFEDDLVILFDSTFLSNALGLVNFHSDYDGEFTTEAIFIAQINTNTNNIKLLQANKSNTSLNNITEQGKQVIKDIASSIGIGVKVVRLV